jgi:predicted histidine transporter YuiF (NhaC family)
MEVLALVGTYAGYVALAFGGMFAHFLKKNIKGETLTEVKKYFKDNFRSTAIAVFGTVVGLVVAISTDSLNFVSAPLIGYTFDSIFNKWDKTE